MQHPAARLAILEVEGNRVYRETCRGSTRRTWVWVHAKIRRLFDPGSYRIQLLEDGPLLSNPSALAKIPGVIVNGSSICKGGLETLGTQPDLPACGACNGR